MQLGRRFLLGGISAMAGASFFPAQSAVKCEKGVSFYAKMYSLAREQGREDDWIVLTSTINDNRASNTLNPFDIGISPEGMTEIVNAMQAPNPLIYLWKGDFNTMRAARSAVTYGRFDLWRMLSHAEKLLVSSHVKPLGVINPEALQLTSLENIKDCLSVDFINSKKKANITT